MLSNPINTTMNIALTGANQILEECPFLESQRDSATKPRVARNELPWGNGPKDKNPNGVSALMNVHRGVATPLGLWFCAPLTQGSSFLATLGFETQSRWDWQTFKIGFAPGKV